MTVQVAAQGAKLGWEVVKTVAFVLLVAGVCATAYLMMSGAKQTRAELERLQAFEQLVYQKIEDRAAADALVAHYLAQRVEHEQQQVQLTITHQNATEEAARADPATYDFLREPVPQRLRDADRQARDAQR